LLLIFRLEEESPDSC